MLAFTPATAWRAASTLLCTPPGRAAAAAAGRLPRCPRAPGHPPRAARMMADGPAEVGVAPPTDPAAETICALVWFVGGGGGGWPAVGRVSDWRSGLGRCQTTGWAGSVEWVLGGAGPS